MNKKEQYIVNNKH